MRGTICCRRYCIVSGPHAVLMTGVHRLARFGGKRGELHAQQVDSVAFDLRPDAGHFAEPGVTGVRPSALQMAAYRR